jgi:Bax protein
VIPEDLAMAQAALETGWGTSDLARQGNNFFGQKATRRHQEHQRIRNTDGLDYRSYDNPGHSVQSYMHNINTHPRYEEFRQARARLRRQQGMTSQLMARELSKHLQAYSTNPSYMTDLNRVMNSLRGT